ncbi:PRC-barrel domain-containing protein [Ramlibacter sp. AW1]|uniref:PRC-barrel domain-containing protein n=1 Tax=Ramlibacter aurantiacus TaxID=2801330 RepID=A0A936ZJ66_9BURK|nr:PRC-barrel domain-containing protein [Ramlibacter aurantiacus]MBL0418726.1 PRC-barrel domain-containing protein [Ramlibacter aurantiacus]
MTHFRKAHPKPLAAAVFTLVLAAGASNVLAQSSGAGAASTHSPMAQQQVNSQQSGSQNYRAMRANDMIGMPVVGRDNQRLGTLSDLVVDINTGDVRYALLSFDRGWFQEDAQVAVPAKQLFQSSRADALVLQNANRDQLMSAAVRRTDDEAGLFGNQPLWTRVDRAWGMDPPAGAFGAMRATRIIDREVNTATEDDIGEIEALVIDLAKSKVHYAVLEFDPGWLSPERKIAVPLTAFQRGRGMESDELSTSLTKQRVASMPALDPNWYGRLNEPAYVAGLDRTFFGAGFGTGMADASTMGSGPNTGLFNRLDTDRNGWIDRRELDAMPDLGQHWSAADANRDGRLTPQEFSRLGERGEGRRQ